jgi:hypothetical protein
MGCISEFSGTTTVSNRDNTSLVEVTGPLTMWGQPVSIEYQERDLSLFGTSTSTSADSSETSSGGSISNTALLPGAASTTGGADPTGSNTSANPISTGTATVTDEGGLSTGAIAGIGVGVGLAAVTAIGALLFFFLRKRRAARAANHDSKGGEHGAGFYANDSKEPFRQHQQQHGELDASTASEYRPELDGSSTPRFGADGGAVSAGRLDHRLRQQPGQYSELE